MKRLIFLIAIVTMAAVLSACASTSTVDTTYPDACYTEADNGTKALCADSIILNKISNPIAVKVAVGTAVLTGVATGKVKAEAVLKVTSAVDALIASDNSYWALSTLLAQKIDNEQIKVVLSILNASGVLDMLDTMTTVSISECDKALLARLIDYINGIVEPYAAED